MAALNPPYLTTRQLLEKVYIRQQSLPRQWRIHKKTAGTANAVVITRYPSAPVITVISVPNAKPSVALYYSHHNLIPLLNVNSSHNSPSHGTVIPSIPNHGPLQLFPHASNKWTVSGSRAQQRDCLENATVQWCAIQPRPWLR